MSCLGNLSAAKNERRYLFVRFGEYNIRNNDFKKCEYRAAEISSAPSNSFTLSREGGNDDGMVCESEETKRNTTQSDKETHAVQEAEKIQ